MYPKCNENVIIAESSVRIRKSIRYLCYSFKMFHVAIVDDEEELLYSLKIILEAENWRVSTYSDPSLALVSFKNALPEVIVMDIVMPGEDGIWLCRQVRKISETVPIIFLSAKVEEIDKIAGLESGADDYLGKPFSTQELIVRIKVQKRRLSFLQQSRSDTRPSVSLNGFSLNKDSMLLSYGPEKTPLTLSEYRILEQLMRKPEIICSREEMLNSVYSEDTYVCDRVIDNHIKRIRDKIRKLSGKDKDRIETVYGIGYRWKET